MGNRRRKRNKFPQYVKRLFRKVPPSTTFYPTGRELRHIKEIQRYRELKNLTKKYGGIWETLKFLENPNTPKQPKRDPFTGEITGYRTVWFTGHQRRK